MDLDRAKDSVALSIQVRYAFSRAAYSVALSRWHSVALGAKERARELALPGIRPRGLCYVAFFWELKARPYVEVGA